MRVLPSRKGANHHICSGLQLNAHDLSHRPAFAARMSSDVPAGIHPAGRVRTSRGGAVESASDIWRRPRAHRLSIAWRHRFVWCIHLLRGVIQLRLRAKSSAAEIGKLH
jgi:hypothetical protein